MTFLTWRNFLEEPGDSKRWGGPDEKPNHCITSCYTRLVTATGWLQDQTRATLFSRIKSNPTNCCLGLLLIRFLYELHSNLPPSLLPRSSACTLKASFTRSFTSKSSSRGLIKSLWPTHSVTSTKSWAAFSRTKLLCRRAVFVITPIAYVGKLFPDNGFDMNMK